MSLQEINQAFCSVSFARSPICARSGFCPLSLIRDARGNIVSLVLFPFLHYIRISIDCELQKVLDSVLSQHLLTDEGLSRLIFGLDLHPQEGHFVINWC